MQGKAFPSRRLHLKFPVRTLVEIYKIHIKLVNYFSGISALVMHKYMRCSRISPTNSVSVLQLQNFSQPQHTPIRVYMQITLR